MASDWRQWNIFFSFSRNWIRSLRCSRVAFCRNRTKFHSARRYRRCAWRSAIAVYCYCSLRYSCHSLHRLILLYFLFSSVRACNENMHFLMFKCMSVIINCDSRRTCVQFRSHLIWMKRKFPTENPQTKRIEPKLSDYFRFGKTLSEINAFVYFVFVTHIDTFINC